MNVNASYYSARGGRERNEDCVSLLEGQSGLLAIVADGLGGYAGGELASREVVSVLNRQLHAASVSTPLLREAVSQANDAVRELQKGDRAMKSTVAALWLDENAAVAANVGDSRIYQFRSGEILYQSTDHSVSQLAVMVGEISREDIRTHPDRNRLLRALGMPDAPKIDTVELRAEQGDRFLLCSDGFWENVTEKDMLRLAAQFRDAGSWLNAMRKLAESGKNADDNHTAIAIVMEPDREFDGKGGKYGHE